MSWRGECTGINRRGLVAKRAVRPRGVVIGSPGIDELPSLIEIDEQALVEKLVTHDRLTRCRTTADAETRDSQDR